MIPSIIVFFMVPPLSQAHVQPLLFYPHFIKCASSLQSDKLTIRLKTYGLLPARINFLDLFLSNIYNKIRSTISKYLRVKRYVKKKTGKNLSFY